MPFRCSASLLFLHKLTSVMLPNAQTPSGLSIICHHRTFLSYQFRISQQLSITNHQPSEQADDINSLDCACRHHGRNFVYGISKHIVIHLRSHRLFHAVSREIFYGVEEWEHGAESGSCFAKQPPHVLKCRITRQLNNHCTSYCRYATHSISFFVWTS